MQAVHDEGAASSESMMLCAKGLTHSYGGRIVLHPFDLGVRAGEVLGLLGPNGAGKSTAIKLMSGDILNGQGKVQLEQRDLSGRPSWQRVRMGLGLLPQHPAVVRDCTVRENLLVAARNNGMSDDAVDEQVVNAGLQAVMHSKAGMLSGGERRRLEIARCMLTNPKALLMDEPFAGVDPVGIEHLQQRIVELAALGLAVLITDHAVHATLGVCDRAIILDHGSVMAEGCPEEIVNNPLVRDRYLGSGFRL